MVLPIVHGASIVPRMLLLDGAVVGPENVAVGERGAILRSSDNGRTWQAVAVPATPTLTGVSFGPGSSQGWAVGHDALILATSDAGRTWQKQWQGDNLQDSFLGVLALDSRRIIAVGAYGLFVVSIDGGQTWIRRKILDNDYHLNRLTRGPTGTLYLAGEHGTLLRSGNDGETWTQIRSSYDGSFYGILPLAPGTLLAYGLRGRVYRSTDDGLSWTLVANDQRVHIATACRLKTNVLVLAGQSRALFLSRDAGITLTTWSPGLTTAIAELLETPDGAVLALGEAGASLLPEP